MNTSSKKTIVVASGNNHKIAEISQILSEYNVVGCKELGFNDEIIEDGKTFYENALIKAKTVSKKLDLPVIADDSGICAQALNGEPGIYSARYAGDGNDVHNNELLLKNLTDKENRKAKFVCALVYYYKGEIISSIGETEGEVLTETKGDGGFGYDPIFYSYDLKKCFGESTKEEKNSVSHRFRALKILKEKLQKQNIL